MSRGTPVANNPAHLAGAIDSPAADKAALMRHCCRNYIVGANVSVPTFTVVIRKGCGLGALGMAGGSF